MEPESNWSGSTTAQCGHSICMPCFLQHTRTNQDATCPMCRGAYVDTSQNEEDDCDCNEGDCQCNNGCDCDEDDCQCNNGCDCDEGDCQCNNGYDCDCSEGDCQCNNGCDCESTCYCADACACDEDYTCDSHAPATATAATAPANPVLNNYKTNNRYSYMDVEN